MCRRPPAIFFVVDTSDNPRGVPGIGAATARELLRGKIARSCWLIWRRMEGAPAARHRTSIARGFCVLARLELLLTRHASCS
jgi:hypothetical protein